VLPPPHNPLDYTCYAGCLKTNFADIICDLRSFVLVCSPWSFRKWAICRQSPPNAMCFYYTLDIQHSPRTQYNETLVWSQTWSRALDLGAWSHFGVCLKPEGSSPTSWVLVGWESFRSHNKLVKISWTIGLALAKINSCDFWSLISSSTGLIYLFHDDNFSDNLAFVKWHIAFIKHFSVVLRRKKKHA